MKKPDAITEITKENFRNKVWSLSADELLYVGRSTFKKLQAVGINTIGDLANSDPYFIRKLLGIHGDQIRTYARGEDQSRVMHKDYVAPIKSVGHGITCMQFARLWAGSHTAVMSGGIAVIGRHWRVSSP